MNRRSHISLLLLSASLLGGLPARADDVPSEPPAPAAQPADPHGIVGRTFLLQSAEGFTVVPGTLPRVSFTETAVRIHAGCNFLEAKYTLVDDALVTTERSSTAIGCDRPRHAQDDWLLSFLRDGPTVLLVDNDLTLKTPTASLRWLDREIADPDRPLVGPTWTIHSFITPSFTVSHSLVQLSTLVLSPDLSVKIETPCNTGSGTYHVGGGRMVLRDIVYTKRDCADARSAEVDAYTQSILRDRIMTPTIEANELTLRAGTYGVIATSP